MGRQMGTTIHGDVAGRAAVMIGLVVYMVYADRFNWLGFPAVWSGGPTWYAQSRLNGRAGRGFSAQLHDRAEK